MVAEAVRGCYCWLQMPFSLVLGVRETVAGHTLGALEAYLPPFQCIPGEWGYASASAPPPPPAAALCCDTHARCHGTTKPHTSLELLVREIVGPRSLGG